MGELQHKCAISLTQNLQDMYPSLWHQKHRGRHQWGIAGYARKGIDIVKVVGEPGEFMDEEGITKIFSKLRPLTEYLIFIGQNRYATSYEEENKLNLQDGGPHRIGGRVEDDNWCYRVIKGAEAVISHNGQVDRDRLLEKIDRSVLRTSCDSEPLLYWWRVNGASRLLRKVPAAYTAIFADIRKNEIEVVRDRFGVRPGVLGEKSGMTIVASEDYAIKKIHGKVLEDLVPGHVYFITLDGKYRKEKIINPTMKRCFMERNYFHYPESIADGVAIASIRTNHGRILASEFHPEGLEYVTDFPSCPEIAARSYSNAVGVEHISVFNKIKGKRSFIGPNPKEREKTISEVLFFLPGMKKFVRGKTGLIVDDSMIRANNIIRCLYLMAEAKAKKIYFALYTPQYGVIGEDGIQRFCNLGIDTPENDDFVARDLALGRNRTVAEIEEVIHKKLRERHNIDIDFSIYYSSTDGMLRGFEDSGIPRDTLCTFCIGGQHPCWNLEQKLTSP